MSWEVTENCNGQCHWTILTVFVYYIVADEDR